MSKSTRPPEHVVPTQIAQHERDGSVPPHAVQEQDELQAATQQIAERQEKRLGINEGGRTNDSSESENPPGAVHGVPMPSLKGTWR